MKATLNQAQELLKLVTQSGIERDKLQTLLESGRFTGLLWEFIRQVGSTTFTLTVDHRLSLAEMIASGEYDWVNEDITAQNFPIDQADLLNVEVQIVQFGRNLTTEQVLGGLEKRGLRPATLVELCALGAAQPELQLQFVIVALGSSRQDPGGNVRCPILGEDLTGRTLNLYRYDPRREWDDDIFRFLAVSK